MEYMVIKTIGLWNGDITVGKILTVIDGYKIYYGDRWICSVGDGYTDEYCVRVR